jgi:hypothetical protein
MAHASAQVTITSAPSPAAVREPSQEQISSDQREMRGLDEQIQEIKSDSLRMAAELSQMEEKLLYPSGTQVAIFVELAKGDTMRLDAVRLQIDGQLVAHYHLQRQRAPGPAQGRRATDLRRKRDDRRSQAGRVVARTRAFVDKL